MLTKGQIEKDKGNAAFKTGDFPKAIGHYTAAFIADPANPTYPLNRAAAYLKLGKNEDAERDCDAVLRLDGKNVKGMFRRGQARVALQKLNDAEADFMQVLKLDPANQVAKQELVKVQAALKAIPAKPRKKVPIDIAGVSPTVSGSLSHPSVPPAPKRRRVPIQIIEPDPIPQSNATPSSSIPTNDSLLTPVSSRSFGRDATTSSPSPNTTPRANEAHAPSPTALPKQPPQTFREAKAAREEARPRGGIFKADGSQKLFTASPPQAPRNGHGTFPKRPPPETLVAFMNLWSSLSTEEERWDVLRQIPATRLPVLFKTSLDASILAAVLHSLRVAIAAAPEDEERLKVVRAYMVNLPRVPRFGTVSLMMSAEERGEAQAIWDILGRYRGDGVEGEMEKRKEEGSRVAWGCSR